MDPSAPPPEDYHGTLLLYFEEEIMGEAYFYGLAEKFYQPAQKDKMVLLAEVERFAAEAIRPLLEKHDLVARPDPVLQEYGREQALKSAAMGWDGFVDYMVTSFPDYMPDFDALEAMAPEEDLKELKILTQHEVVAIEFANLEKAGDPNSTAPLLNFLGRV